MLYMSLSGDTQPENTPINTEIGVIAMNNDPSNSAWEYSIVSDPDDVFTLDGNTLKNAVVFNYDNSPSHSVAIKAHTSGQPDVVNFFTIGVLNVTESSSSSWRTNRNIIGGGGWATGIDIADDDTKIIRNDVTGVFFRKDADDCWTPLMRNGDNIYLTDIIGCGIYDAAIAHSNSDHMAFIQWGRLYMTTDGGKTLEENTAWIGDPKCAPNDSLRTMGAPLRYDPVNPFVLFSCTPTHGVRFTLDGGKQWITVPVDQVPLPTKAAIAFDATSVTDGRCMSVYISIGTALYWTGDGGFTWWIVPGSEDALICHIAVDPFTSFLHVIGHPTNMDYNSFYNRWDGRNWLNATNAQGHSVCVSPATGYVYIMDTSGSTYLSTDGGLHFSGYMDKHREADRITWHETTDEWYMANGNFCIDSHDVIWMVEGIGAWTSLAPQAHISLLTWTEASVGCESMVIDSLNMKPDGTLLAAMHDRTAMVIPKPGIEYPTINANDGVRSIRHSNGIDWAQDDPDFLVCTVMEGNGMYSPSNGANWYSFEGDIRVQSGDYGGGNIIAFDSNTILQAQTNDGKFMRTVDGGRNWDEVIFGNGARHMFHHMYPYQRSILIRDRFVDNAGWVYLINSDAQTPDDLSSRGLWRITDKGATLERILDGYISHASRDFFNGKLVQRSANELWWTAGDAGFGVQRSLDGGRAWNDVAGDDNINGTGFVFSDTYGIAFGPSEIYAIGHRMNGHYAPTNWDTYGLWMSANDGKYWTRILHIPEGYIDRPSCMAADPNVYGKCYIGYPSAGIVMVEFK